MIRPWLNRTKWAQHLNGIEPQTILSAASWVQPQETGADMLRFVARAGEQMLGECLSRGDNASDIALRHLANFTGASDGQLEPIPFKSMQETTTHTRYFHAWIRLLFYVIRINQRWINFGHLDRTLFKLTDEQLAAVREILHLAEQEAFLEDGMTKMKDALLALSTSLITQLLPGDRFESAVLSYAAARGLSDTSGVWEEAGHITGDLNGLIWCSQVVILGYSYSIFERHGTEHGVTSIVMKMSKRWLNNTKETPVMYLLVMNLYMRKVAENNPAPGKILWADSGNKILYEDISFTMVELKSLFLSMLTKAEAKLLKDLLFNTEQDTSLLTAILPSGQITALTDSLVNATFGHSFVMSPSNNLSQLASFCKSRLGQSHALSSSFFYSDISGYHVRLSTVRAYQKKVTQFLELLAVLIHLTGGAPPRATELVGLRWANNELRRDIFMYDGLAMLLPSYNKTQAMMDATKIIPRFMPLRVTRLYVLFLASVKPFLRYLHHMEFGVETNLANSLGGSRFLFSTSAGTPLASTKITECLGQEATFFLGRKLGVHMWRHMCKAIIREHLPSGNKSALEGYFEDQSDDGNGNDAVWAAQFGHSVRTGAMVYGRDVKLGTSIEENISHFRRISVEWHSFLGLDKDITIAAQPIPRQFLVPPPPSSSTQIDFSAARSALYGPEQTSSPKLSPRQVGQFL